MSLAHAADTRDERIAELEEQVAYLKGELGLAIDVAKCARLKQATALSPYACRIALRLYDAYPRPLAKWVLLDTESPTESDSFIRTADVYIHRIRKRLGLGSVITHYGTGFSLSPEGHARVRSMLDQTA